MGVLQTFYPTMYARTLGEEGRMIKTVLNERIPMKFRYQKTCGLYDLTYTVEDTYIVKFESGRTTKQDLQRIGALCDVLNTYESLAPLLPDMTVADYEIEPGHNVCALWYKKLDGRLLPFRDMYMYRCAGRKQHEQLDGFMEQLGTFMARLHGVRIMDVAHLFPQSIPGQILTAVKGALPQLSYQDPSCQKMIAEQALDALCPSYDEVLCHKDLNPWNLLRNENNDLVGVIDLGMANIGRRDSETRFWEYTPKHRDIIERAYEQTLGAPFIKHEPVLITTHQALSSKRVTAVCQHILEKQKSN